MLFGGLAVLSQIGADQPEPFKKALLHSMRWVGSGVGERIIEILRRAQERRVLAVFARDCAREAL